MTAGRATGRGRRSEPPLRRRLPGSALGTPPTRPRLGLLALLPQELQFPLELTRPVRRLLQPPLVALLPPTMIPLAALPVALLLEPGDLRLQPISTRSSGLQGHGISGAGDRLHMARDVVVLTGPGQTAATMELVASPVA